jgi:hypothetical protein
MTATMTPARRTAHRRYPDSLDTSKPYVRIRVDSVYSVLDIQRYCYEHGRDYWLDPDAAVVELDTALLVLTHLLTEQAGIGPVSVEMRDQR